MMYAGMFIITYGRNLEIKQRTRSLYLGKEDLSPHCHIISYLAPTKNIYENKSFSFFHLGRYIGTIHTIIESTLFVSQRILAVHWGSHKTASPRTTHNISNNNRQAPN